MNKEEEKLERALIKRDIYTGDFGDLADAYGLYCYPESVLSKLKSYERKIKKLEKQKVTAQPSK